MEEDLKIPKILNKILERKVKSKICLILYIKENDEIHGQAY